MTSQLYAIDDRSDSASTTFGMVALALFALLRPITVSFHHVGGVSLLDIFGIGSSYLMLLALLANLRNVRVPSTGIFIAFYAFYCILSLCWGSAYRDVVRAVAPFLTFFLVLAAVRTEGQAKFLLGMLSIGYLLPVIGSIYLILSNRSEITVTGSLLERQAGLASGVHTAGHLMLFFSFAFVMYHLLDRESGTAKNLLLALILAGSLFCMYKTFTRTAFLGGIVFWSCYFLLTSRKRFFLFLAALAVVSLTQLPTLQNMVMQKQVKKGVYDVNAAGSGRGSLWKHTLAIYADLPASTQLLGVGLGQDLTRVPGSHLTWAGSHNDYLSLLVTVGAIGLVIYLLIYGSFALAVLRSPWKDKMRYFALSVLLAVLLMNFVSNSYVVRFQMAQLLWFLFGLVYACGLARPAESGEVKEERAVPAPVLLVRHAR